VVVVEPAAVASNFVANAGLDPDRLVSDAGPYGPVLRAYLERSSQAFASAQDAGEVGDLVVSLIAAVDPPFRVQTSSAARAFITPKLADLDGSAVQAMTQSWL